MKPCPFCASNEINLHYPDEHGHYVCWCGNCGAFGPNDVSEARAREMWNLRRMKYSQDDPKWVQADSVEAGGSGTVHVVAYGQRFEYCPVRWNDPYRDSSKSDVLVQNSQGDWLRVWFYDEDMQPR